MSLDPLQQYLQGRDASDIDAGFVAYLANLTNVAKTSPRTAAGIVGELRDQRAYLKLIASENYCSMAVQSAMGNLLTDKYAEGIPAKRFYAGCANVDDIEDHARKLACELFGAEHAYVQPHSGADANMIAFWAILTAKVEVPALEALDSENPVALSQADWESVRQKLGSQRLLAMELSAGGHLTHGYRHNVSAKMFDAYGYGVHPETHLIDYEALEAKATELRPLILLAGYSAYSRRVNFRRMREIADKVDAVLMVDMAHFAGLVAGGVFSGDFDPVPHAHVVTSTTHKTLRGPRGGIVLCVKELADQVDRGCPLVIGGPLPHVVAAKAVAFQEALHPDFRDYSARIVRNAQALCKGLQSRGYDIVTGGTENHLVLVDVTGAGLTGRQAELALRDCGITLNRNTVPNDAQGPWYTSGLRLGTAALTTLGMGEAEMEVVAETIHTVLESTTPTTAKSGKPSRAKYRIDEAAQQRALSSVRELLQSYPLYGNLDVTFLQEAFLPAAK